MKTHMQENRPRTDAGRTVDTWKFRLPDGGSVAFKVTLHSDNDSAWFTATTDDADFRVVNLRCPDINRLKSELTARVEGRLDVLMAAEWTPSKMLEMSYSDRAYFRNHGVREIEGVTITFGFAAVSANTALPVGNRGETMITTGEGPITAIQRAHDEVFVKPTSMQDIHTINAREYSDQVSRTIVPDTDDHDARSRALLGCLKTFAVLMGDRMAPSSVGRQGLPSPDDLVAMMRAAATPTDTPDMDP